MPNPPNIPDSYWSKLPCINCLCVALCEQKSWFKRFDDCILLDRYCNENFDNPISFVYCYRKRIKGGDKDSLYIYNEKKLY